MSADLLAVLGKTGEEILQQARSVVKDAGVAVDAALFDTLHIASPRRILR